MKSDSYWVQKCRLRFCQSICESHDIGKDSKTFNLSLHSFSLPLQIGWSIRVAQIELSLSQPVMAYGGDLSKSETVFFVGKLFQKEIPLWLLPKKFGLKPANWEMVCRWIDEQFRSHTPNAEPKLNGTRGVTLEDKYGKNKGFSLVLTLIIITVIREQSTTHDWWWSMGVTLNKSREKLTIITIQTQNQRSFGFLVRYH